MTALVAALTARMHRASLTPPLEVGVICTDDDGPAAADEPPSTPPGAGGVPSGTRRASLLASHELQNQQPS